jgi:hypothetical protein
MSRALALASLIMRMSLKWVEFYINLHSQILDVSTENHGYGESPSLELEFHGNNLKRIRASYNNRLQVLCSLYSYLRHGDVQNWRSIKLQEKMYKSLQSKMSSISNLEKIYKDLNAEMKSVKKSMSSNASTHKPCYHCGSSKHAGGRGTCPRKDLSQ